jgi:hypothetical protein
MSACIFLELPEAISRLVLVEWVRVEDVARLDSAVCNIELREHFLTLAYNPLTVLADVTNREKHYGNMEPVLEWADMRGAQLDGIVIEGKFLRDEGSSLLSAMLKTSGLALKWVKIFSNRLDAVTRCQEALLEIIKWCPNVTQLELSIAETRQGTMLWDEHLVAFTLSCPTLTELVLINAELSEHALASVLKRCQCLQTVFIHTLFQAIPVDIAIPTLKSIKCGPGLGTDAVMLAIAQKCAKLETLIMLQSTLVTDVGVQAVLNGCPLLRETDAYEALNTSRELCVELARRSNTTSLHTGKWWRMDDEMLQEVLGACPNLTSISWEQHKWYSIWPTDLTLAVCAQHCPLLADISIRGCTRITDAGMRVLVKNGASKLRSVELRNCPELSNKTLLAIAKRCPLLEKIIWGVDGSDAGVVKLAEGCPQLNFVELFNTQVGDAGLTALATHCPKLATLKLKYCDHVTIRGVRDVVTGCTQLRNLEVPLTLKEQLLPVLAALPGAPTVRYSSARWW